MKVDDLCEDVKDLFWGAVGECDCDNESARKGMDAVAEYIAEKFSESENMNRILADAADANVKSAAYERVEHSKTAKLLRMVICESGGYLQTLTREKILAHLAIIGNAFQPPNVRDHRAGPEDPSKTEPSDVAGTGESTCWAGLPGQEG